MSIATNYLSFTTSPITISEGSIIVHGILLTSTTDLLGSDFTFYEGDGVTMIDKLRVPIRQSREYAEPFLADRGLVITGASDTKRCTVFYSNVGA